VWHQIAATLRPLPQRLRISHLVASPAGDTFRSWCLSSMRISLQITDLHPPSSSANGICHGD
jgi:hypothetical protein